jgi:ribonucleotide monophosphatase NagD (HAD superfamily)
MMKVITFFSLRSIGDIKGAKEAGLRTIFVPSQFNSLKDLAGSNQEPDRITKDLPSISKILAEMLPF